MNEETKTEPNVFEVPVYATVWKGGLESYVYGDNDHIRSMDVDLKVGTVPTDYSEYHVYMPVGVVRINIPSKTERVQTELLAIDAEIEAEKLRGVERLEELQERRQQLLALPHLPEVEEEELAATTWQAALDEEDRTSD